VRVVVVDSEHMHVRVTVDELAVAVLMRMWLGPFGHAPDCTRRPRSRHRRKSATGASGIARPDSVPTPMPGRCRFADSVPMSDRSFIAASSTAASPAPAEHGVRIVVDAARAASASVRLLPASHPVSGRPDSAYAGAGR
jgi:hypothetical protein